MQVCVGKLCGPVANEAPVYQLDLKVERIFPAKCIELEVVGAEPVIFLPKSRAAKKKTSEDEASIAEDDYDFHQDEDSDDAESLQSQVEEAAEIEQEEADTGKSDEEAPFGTLERHAPGTHLVSIADTSVWWTTPSEAANQIAKFWLLHVSVVTHQRAWAQKTSLRHAKLPNLTRITDLCERT